MTEQGPHTTTVYDADTGRPFTIGGNQGPLPEEEQLAQLAWYIEQHHPAPAGSEDYERWRANLPDRLTHAAMMMLGTAAGHAWPGSHLPATLTVEDNNHGTLITPPNPTQGVWIISAHDGDYTRHSGIARDMAWLPTVAALACEAHATVLDVDYPHTNTTTPEQQLTPIQQAAHWARQQGATTLIGYGSSRGAELIAHHHQLWDAMILNHPHLDTDSSWPPTLNQGTTYPTKGHILTPATARARIHDAARFITT